MSAPAQRTPIELIRAVPSHDLKQPPSICRKKMDFEQVFEGREGQESTHL